MKNFELHNTEIKGDTVIIDFADETGTVTLQVSKETLMNHLTEMNMNALAVCGDYWSVLDPATYPTENLTEVVQSYLEEL